MKTFLIGWMTTALVATVMAVDKGELDQRVRTLTAKLEALQGQPDKTIPAGVLHRAQGVVLLERTKAGLLFAYQGGSGVALARDPRSETWSPVAFVSANDTSMGFQIGGEYNFLVIVLMDINTNHLLTERRFDFGGEARGTAGDSSAGVEGSLNGPEQPVLVYADRKGLYGGAAVKAGTIRPEDNANRVYYGRSLTMKDILFDKKAEATQPSKDLAATITKYSNNSAPWPRTVDKQNCEVGDFTGGDSPGPK